MYSKISFGVFSNDMYANLETGTTIKIDSLLFIAVSFQQLYQITVGAAGNGS